MDSDIKCGIVIFVIIALVMLVLGIIAYNQTEEDICLMYKNSYHVILDETKLIHQCLFVEDGKEYNKREIYKKHKFDGMETRK